MYKLLSITTLVLFLMTLSICLTGCSVSNKSDEVVNNSSSTSQINGTNMDKSNSNTNQPNHPDSVITIKPSDSPSDDNTIDFNKYIHRIWIDRSLMNSDNKGISFYISSITNDELVGKCTVEGLHGYCIPEVYQDMGYADLTGIIKNDIAYCDYYSKIHNAGGDFEIKFISDNEIEMFDPYLNESCIYTPYTINDAMELEGFIPNENYSFEVDLNSWENVNFVSGEIADQPAFYLTNKEGDILFDLFIGFGKNINTVKDILIQDINKDDLKDIIIIAADKNDSSNIMAKVIFQLVDGMFDIDGILSSEINETGNNQDIKSVLDYLSKKF